MKKPMNVPIEKLQSERGTALNYSEGINLWESTSILRWILERIYPLPDTTHGRPSTPPNAAIQSPNTLRPLQNRIRQRIVSENILFVLRAIPITQ